MNIYDDEYANWTDAMMALFGKVFGVPKLFLASRFAVLVLPSQPRTPPNAALEEVLLVTEELYIVTEG